MQYSIAAQGAPLLEKLFGRYVGLSLRQWDPLILLRPVLKFPTGVDWNDWSWSFWISTTRLMTAYNKQRLLLLLPRTQGVFD